jgi:hypothetical protein
MTNNTLRYLALAAVLIAFAAPALAQNPFYGPPGMRGPIPSAGYEDMPYGGGPSARQQQSAKDFDDWTKANTIKNQKEENERKARLGTTNDPGFNDVLPCIQQAARFSHSDPSRLTADLFERCHIERAYNHRDDSQMNVDFLGSLVTLATNDGRFDTAWADEHCKMVLSGIRCEWNGYAFKYRR